MVIIFIAFITFFLRLLPLLNLPHRGCDAYYFLLCVEEFKKDRKIPIVLPPYYMLEQQEQWYPPGFTIFLSLFPQRWIKKYYWVVSPFIDTLIGMLAMVISFYISNSVQAAIVTGIIYAFSLSVISETRNLTSRQLGSLFINVAMFGLFWAIPYGIWWGYMLFLTFGFLLLMTHKLSTQNLFVSLSFFTLIMKDFTYLFALIILIGSTILLSKGLYLKILKAHIDIILFWKKNWPFLGAHPIYHSPVYGKPEEYRNLFYHSRGIIKQLLKILFGNVLVIIILLKSKTILNNDIFYSQLFWWITSTFCLSYLITLVPQLRSIGEGYKYIKHIVPSIAILGGYLFISFPFIISMFIIWYIIEYIIWFTKEKNRKFIGETAAVDNEFKEIIDYLKTLDHIKIVCIPYHLSDAVAYYARRQVFWGTHNFPFSMVQDFYPVWRKRLSEFKILYNLTHLLVDKRYINPEILGQDIRKLSFSTENYCVYEL